MSAQLALLLTRVDRAFFPANDEPVALPLEGRKLHVHTDWGGRSLRDGRARRAGVLFAIGVVGRIGDVRSVEKGVMPLAALAAAAASGARARSGSCTRVRARAGRPPATPRAMTLGFAEPARRARR